MKVFDSPEMQKLREAWQAACIQQNSDDESWWDSLDYDQRAQAFRQVIKLMHKTEIVDRGSYRWAMDTFGLNYGEGLSHYMQLHNLVFTALDAEKASRKNEENEDNVDKPVLP